MDAATNPSPTASPQLVQSVRTVRGQADRELMKYVGAALRNLCVRAAEELAQCCADESTGLLASLVAACSCLSSGVEWEVEDSAAVVHGVFVVVAQCPEQMVAVEQVVGPMLAELQGLLEGAHADASHIDLASAEDATALLGRIASALHALAQSDAGAAAGRMVLMGGAEVLQMAAAEWVDDDVAGAIAELLRRAVPLVQGASDELVTWLGSVRRPRLQRRWHFLCHFLMIRCISLERYGLLDL